MNFDRDTAKIIMKRLQEAIQPLEKEFQIKLKVKSLNFSTNDFTAKLEGSSIDASGQVHSKEADNFTGLGKYYGFAPDDLGKTFQCMGKTYTITGLAVGSRKFPVQATRADGKKFKFPVNEVLRYLGKQPRPDLY